MKIDTFGQQLLTEDDACNFYMRNPDQNLKSFLTQDNIKNTESLGIDNFPKIIPYVENAISQKEFDKLNQQKWCIPEEYKSFDIALYVLGKCQTEEELQRAGQELLLYNDLGLFPLLQYLKYLVDTMKEKNIVWGVGRGSSVASYVLFLLDVHRINSLYYDLSIDEFLK